MKFHEASRMKTAALAVGMEAQAEAAVAGRQMEEAIDEANAAAAVAAWLKQTPETKNKDFAIATLRAKAEMAEAESIVAGKALEEAEVTLAEALSVWESVKAAEVRQGRNNGGIN